jgi:hypothetical protein
MASGLRLLGWLLILLAGAAAAALVVQGLIG